MGGDGGHVPISYRQGQLVELVGQCLRKILDTLNLGRVDGRGLRLLRATCQQSRDREAQ